MPVRNARCASAAPSSEVDAAQIRRQVGRALPGRHGRARVAQRDPETRNPQKAPRAPHILSEHGSTPRTCTGFRLHCRRARPRIPHRKRSIAHYTPCSVMRRLHRPDAQWQYRGQYREARDGASGAEAPARRGRRFRRVGPPRHRARTAPTRPRGAPCRLSRGAAAIPAGPAACYRRRACTQGRAPCSISNLSTVRSAARSTASTSPTGWTTRPSGP